LRKPINGKIARSETKSTRAQLDPLKIDTRSNPREATGRYLAERCLVVVVVVVVKIECIQARRWLRMRSSCSFFGSSIEMRSAIEIMARQSCPPRQEVASWYEMIDFLQAKSRTRDTACRPQTRLTN
jgi:hypothetical protein